jgi:Cyclic nucleotide-binding domain
LLTLMDTPPFLANMERKAKALALALDKSLNGMGEEKHVHKDSDLLTFSPASLIQIQNGVFRCQYGEKTIRLYSSGDFLLSPENGEADGLVITSEFGSQISVISHKTFLDALCCDRNLLENWLAYQNLETRISHLLCSLYIVDEVKHRPEIRQYKEGDIIIREEDNPVEVFEMITGTASVTAKGYSLSVINSGEVFGELSFFTGLKRTATVTALEPCLVQVIDQVQFIRIMKYRPNLVDGMLRTLCQRLVDLNVRISEPKPT